MRLSSCFSHLARGYTQRNFPIPLPADGDNGILPQFSVTQSFREGEAQSIRPSFCVLQADECGSFWGRENLTMAFNAGEFIVTVVGENPFRIQYWITTLRSATKAQPQKKTYCPRLTPFLRLGSFAVKNPYPERPAILRKTRKVDTLHCFTDFSNAQLILHSYIPLAHATCSPLPRAFADAAWKAALFAGSAKFLTPSILSFPSSSMKEMMLAASYSTVVPSVVEHTIVACVMVTRHTMRTPWQVCVENRTWRTTFPGASIASWTLV